MSFAPVLPLDGLVGWRFLQKTYDRQITHHSKSPEFSRDVAYFKKNIATVSSAGDLVSDRRLFKVALTAFGLQDDLNNRAFLRSLLEADPKDRTSLVNKISDSRYKAMNEAFGFSSGAPKTARPGFASKIVAQFRARSFELAVGEQSTDLRLTLSAQREIGALAEQDLSESTKWYRVLGQPPLRRFFETTLGLPGSFAKIDLEQQVETLKSKSQKYFGVQSFDEFAQPEMLERSIQRFHLMSQMSLSNQMTSSSIALTLLQR